jgi:hypothetical protein
MQSDILMCGAHSITSSARTRIWNLCCTVASVISFSQFDIGRTDMIRTIVSLDPDDKAWLDRKARQERTPMTRLVRRAIQRLRQESESNPSPFDRLLRETSGLRKFGDGLAYQRKLRREWGSRK